MKIYVLGHKGMLGRYVYTYLKSKGHITVGISRDEFDAASYTEVQLRAVLFHKKLNNGDVIINCIGTIKPMVDKHGTLNAIKVNSLFPHLLANVCEKEGYKMIHITTDCVFSGNDGQYKETSLHDCTDVYGKSKSLGEPENCTVVRTSIIGEEIGTSRSLLEWVKSMKGKTANGYTNHFWNGLTCLQVAKVFEDIIVNNKYWNGVRHVFSDDYTKCALLNTISRIYELGITVNSVEAPTRCDRTMSTTFNTRENIMNSIRFDIPNLETQIIEQRDFYPILFGN